MIGTVTKWLKLRRVAEEITKKPTDIHLSTEFDERLNLRSHVVFNDMRVDVFLNARYAKEMDWIVDSMAHELAHVFYGDSGHKEVHLTWDDTVESTKCVIIEKMRA